MAPPTAASADLWSLFYPFGNTPAVNLAEKLPPETDGRLLFLGCGDVRNVLFTIFSNSNS